MPGCRFVYRINYPFAAGVVNNCYGPRGTVFIDDSIFYPGKQTLFSGLGGAFYGIGAIGYFLLAGIRGGGYGIFWRIGTQRCF